MKNISFIKLIASVILFARRARRYILRNILISLFSEHGSNIFFDPDDTFTYDRIKLGSDVYIGPGAKFSASRSQITIGNKVMFGPNVTIMGGDHNTEVIGKYMYDVKHKLPQNDLPIAICDDVWVGANSTILKGVTIGQGSIVAAGSVVTRSVPENCIVGGIPARLIRSRFSQNELIEHKQRLKSSHSARE